MDKVDVVGLELAIRYRPRAWQTIEVDLGPPGIQRRLRRRFVGVCGFKAELKVPTLHENRMIKEKTPGDTIWLFFGHTKPLLAEQHNRITALGNSAVIRFADAFC